MDKKGFGAIPSKKDRRTINHAGMKTLAAPYAPQGGYTYQPNEIEDQDKVGICTAISLTQNAKKAIGRPFSADFQYLLQKKYIDGSWDEGSSIFSALKVGKKYGFLPAELWTYTTQADRNLPYNQYIQKLQAVPDAEIQNLITQCSDYKLSGYAQVNIDPSSIAQAINSSKSGILMMFQVGDEWWTAPDGRVSWASADIDPLRPPQVIVSGHAITNAAYNYISQTILKLANTWSAEWDIQGSATLLFDTYKPREAWIPYYGLNEQQIQELHNNLQQQIGLLQKVVALLLQLIGKK